MKKEFRLKYKEGKVSQIVKEIYQKLAHKTNNVGKLYDSTIVEIMLSDEFIEVEIIEDTEYNEYNYNAGEYNSYNDYIKHSIKDKKNILNILRKHMHLSQESTRDHKEYIHNTLYYFTHDIFKGENIDYIIYNSSVDSKKSIFRNATLPVDSNYILITDCVHNNSEMSTFLQYTSDRADIYAHKKACTIFLDALLNYNPNVSKSTPKLYTLNELYTKTHTNSRIMLIDYGMELIYKKRELLTKIFCIEKDVAQDKYLSFLEKDSAEYAITPYELGIIMSIIKYKEEIKHEISVYLVSSDMLKLLGQSLNSFDYTPYNLMQAIGKKHSKMGQFYKSKADDLFKIYLEEEEKYRKKHEIIDKINKESIEVDNSIYDEYYLSKHLSSLAHIKYQKKVECLKFIKENREIEKEYSLLHASQKTYIKDKIKKDFKVSSKGYLCCIITMALCALFMILLMVYQRPDIPIQLIRISCIQ